MSMESSRRLSALLEIGMNFLSNDPFMGFLLQLIWYSISNFKVVYLYLRGVSRLFFRTSFLQVDRAVERA
jgi:hypothetical protein